MRRGTVDVATAEMEVQSKPHVAVDCARERARQRPCSSSLPIIPVLSAHLLIIMDDTFFLRLLKDGISVRFNPSSELGDLD